MTLVGKESSEFLTNISSANSCQTALKNSSMTAFKNSLIRVYTQYLMSNIAMCSDMLLLHVKFFSIFMVQFSD